MTDAPRPLPSHIDAEQGVLGDVMVNNSVYGTISGFLRPRHFSDPFHGGLFEAIGILIADSRAATPVTLAPALGGPDHIIGSGVRVGDYLARLVAGRMPPALTEQFARMVVDAAARRDIIAKAQFAIEDAYGEPLRRADEIVTKVEADLASTRKDFLTQTLGNRKTAGDGARALIDRAYQVVAGDIKREGVTTGFPDLDDMTGGYEPGILWVVAGRPGMGKSVYMVTSSSKTARAAGVLVFSLEMPERQVVARYLADLCYDPRHHMPFTRILRASELDETEFWLLEDSQKRLAKMSLVIDASSSIGLDDLVGRIRREQEAMAKAGQRLAVVFIDYLKFVSVSDRYRGQRHYEVGEITAGLKGAAKDLGICIVLLAQLNRGNEARDDKRPGLADLRESGDIEADADVVVFLHRESYYLARRAKGGDPSVAALVAASEFQAELIISKNRSGPTKTLDIWCDVGASTMASQSDRDRM
jgi:replicative DNA helicase